MKLRCLSFVLLILFVALAGCTPATTQPAPPVGTDQAQALSTPTARPAASETASFTAPPAFTAPATFTATLVATPLPSATPSPTFTPTPEVSIHFAVIGDYGEGGQPEADVAAMVKSWNPDFIITTGDNNYPLGEAQTIDEHIGQFYHAYIAPYKGSYGAGADTNRFFPSLGNHDWYSDNARPYLDYFTLPGNERYYDFAWGPVHFYALDSDTNEPDKVGTSSKQAAWLKEKLSQASEPWRVVYSHFPPYSSGTHGPSDYIRWPFKEWGASIYLCGHDHLYERLEVSGFPYIIDGSGGGPLYDFTTISEGSQVRYNKDYGALLVTASSRQITFEFYTRTGTLIDSYSLTK